MHFCESNSMQNHFYIISTFVPHINVTAGLLVMIVLFGVFINKAVSSLAVVMQKDKPEI